MAGAAKIRMTPQNMAYADDRGQHRLRVIGSLPRREKGTGNLISDGEKVKSNWNGNIPDDAYPMVKNPPRGFVTTANNKSVKDYPYEMNGTFSPGYRYENIARLLRDKTGIDVEYMKKAQTDTHTVMAEKVQAILKKYVTVGGR